MKTTAKAYWDMTAEELKDATKELDEEFVAERARPMSAEMRARWKRAKAKRPTAENGHLQETITVRLDKSLVDRCTALAKKKRVSRDSLIARGLREFLTTEGG